MDKFKNVERVFSVIDNALSRVDSSLDYDRLCDALILLAAKVSDYEGQDTEDCWYIGECGEFCLVDLIVGAFWHFSEWHGGQSSKGYAALSAFGMIYNPNSETVDADNGAYQALNDMASLAFLDKIEGAKNA
jgi:hypothetical protein